MSRRTFFCIDAHACGNPVRLVAGGGPALPNLPMAERREIFLRDHDWVRRALMFEPRGHDIMSGAILYPPSRQDCDCAVLFIEVSSCLPMCGAGTIGLVTAALEEGLITPRQEGRLALETPAGRVDVEYHRNGPYVESVRLFNVASFLDRADVKVDVPGMGEMTVDIAYGGNFYAVVEPQRNWAGLDAMNAAELVAASRALLRALAADVDPRHPEDSRIGGLHHVIWCDEASRTQGAHGRSAVFYGDKAIGRSPGGTGTSARMAQLHGKGRLAAGQAYVNESLIGTTYEGRVESVVPVGEGTGILPSIQGWARVIRHNTIFVDDRDPLAHGFQLL